MTKTISYQCGDAGFFRYRKVGGRYLLTNEAGEHLSLGEGEFQSFIDGRLDRHGLVYTALAEKHFTAGGTQKELVECYRRKFSFAQSGTSLHIVIPTLRCNQCCIYCHAKAHDCGARGYDMDRKTAVKVVDAIFQSPNHFITIEFQGGEPLLNWDILAFITAYALKKNRAHKKSLRITMVSNLTLMTQERYHFLKKHQVSICTSLDGPAFIHDRNRPMAGGGSAYRLVTYWLKRLFRESSGFHGSALATLTRFSMDYPREIINEYMKWGVFSIPLRPVSVLGYAGERRNALGVTAEEFLRFYYKAMEYLFELNTITREKISERMTIVCLQKIFNSSDPGYLDLRSPCGAGCGQLAYMHDGSVYTCDEARMLGDDAFKLGNVKSDSYNDLMHSGKLKAAVFASCIDGLYCDYCAYKPYCGVCPVVNWKEYGTLYAQPNVSFMCKVNKGMFDYIFKALQDKAKSRILKSWIDL